MRDLRCSRRRRGGGRRARPLRDPGPRRLPHAPLLRRRSRRTSSTSRSAVQATRSCMRRVEGSCRRSRRPGRPARTPSGQRSGGTAGGCSARARRPSRASRATGSTATPSSRRCARSVRKAAFRPGLAAHAVPPEYDDADAYLDFAIEDVLPEAREDRGGGRRLPRARGIHASSRRGGTWRRAERRVSSSGCTATSSRSRARSSSRSSSALAPSTTSRRPATTGIRRLAASEVVGVVLPVAALVLGRPMPRARELVDAGGALAPRHRLQPGQRILRIASARRARWRARSSACRPPKRSPRSPSTPHTCCGVPIGSGGSRRGSTPISCSSTLPTGGTSPTTSAARS